MNKKLSFIIPIYNTSGYLKRCFDSILNQNNVNVEIIAIDDGSSDSSAMICDDYAKKYPDFFRVIHKKNEGQALARNMGITLAEADYVCFIDSDDYLEMDTLDILIDEIKSNVDIYEFGYRVFKSGNMQSEQLPIQHNDLMTPTEYLKCSMATFEYEWYPWKYIFNKKLFENGKNEFPKGLYYEDVFLMPRIILSARSIKSIRKYVYNYILGRTGATTSGIRLKAEMDKLKVISSNVEFCALIDDYELSALLKINFSKMYYSSLMVLYGIKDKKEREELRSYLHDNINLTMNVNTGIYKIINWFIKFVGFDFTAWLLNIRRMLKNVRNKF